MSRYVFVGAAIGLLSSLVMLFVASMYVGEIQGLRGAQDVEFSTLLAFLLSEAAGFFGLIAGALCGAICAGVAHYLIHQR
jgi:hypothetical protein